MIVVCGEALIDIIHNGDGSQRAAPGGGPFNTARSLARLGVPTAFLGRLSNDTFGRQLVQALESDGVSLELASIGPEPTTIAVAEVDNDGLAEYQFEVQGTSAPNLTLDMIPPHLGKDVPALHFGTLGLVLEPMASTLLELLERQREGRLVMVDPNIRVGLMLDGDYRDRLHEVLPRCTIVKASEADFRWLYPDSSYQRAADRLLDEGVAVVVVTLGAQGAFAAHRNCRLHVEAVHVQVVDTIGAGDAFGAGLLAWLHDHGAIKPDLCLEESELRSAVEYACLAAALTCARAGADPPWRSEMPAAPPTLDL
jgi:fructokinase